MARPLRALWFGFPYPSSSEPSEDSEGSLLFLAVTSPNVHPTGFASLAIGWCDFVVNRRNARCPQGVDVPQWALVMAHRFGNFLLGQCWPCGHQQSTGRADQER